MHHSPIPTLLLASLLIIGCSDREPSGDADSPRADRSAQATDSPGSAEAEDRNDGMDAATPALAEDDVAFMKRLGLIRGHLHAGHALYVDGRSAMAETHMKHPRDELYAGLVPAIEARGLKPFDAELTALKRAVEAGAPSEDVTAAWREVDGAIESIERATAASPRDELLAVAAMLDTAAEEYAIGVVDGVVDNVHEYQDAWGFTQVALERIGQIVVTTDVEREVTAEAGVAISSLEDLWPNLDPKVRLDADETRIIDAADRVRALADDLETETGAAST
ncbi:hypothetical protein HFP89_14330 [Wenzhouxiangella sp. XN79A]|uniref:hypothetical protein n=1 Tax=Wenzhouxiangella sp. XN79A TaxID=2724193 RepID=UPI00144A81E5|nr:hypothetical protein [Wenzhouxiangella sp. XN79A]NKI36344.1 hypothetical protein [Wenzhouxiangella sp. XN79A]